MEAEPPLDGAPQEHGVEDVSRLRAKLEYKGVGRAGWVGDYMDPNTFLELFITTTGDNGTGWYDQKYVDMLRAANRQTDSAKRYADDGAGRKDTARCPTGDSACHEFDELDEEAVRERDASQPRDDSRLEVRLHRARPRQVG